MIDGFLTLIICSLYVNEDNETLYFEKPTLAQALQSKKHQGWMQSKFGS